MKKASPTISLSRFSSFSFFSFSFSCWSSHFSGDPGNRATPLNEIEISYKCTCDEIFTLNHNLLGNKSLVQNQANKENRFWGKQFM